MGYCQDVLANLNTATTSKILIYNYIYDGSYLQLLTLMQSKFLQNESEYCSKNNCDDFQYFQ